MGIRKLFQSKSVRITVGLLGSAGVIVAALYPIAISPYRHPEEWKRIQRESREGIDREKIQPGGMRVWSSPFAPQPPPTKSH